MIKFLMILFFVFLSNPLKADFSIFPESDAESLLLMSTDEILSFSKKMEIDIYKFTDPVAIESKDIAVNLLNKIPFVDQVKFSKFDLFNGLTLGVYFSKNSYNLELPNDTIIFSDQADRWTIVHEFSHALLDKNRSSYQKKNELKSVDEIVNAKEDYEEVMRLYQTFGKFPSKNHLVRAINSISVWSDLMLNFLYTYELEEVRIEKFLQKLYETKTSYKLDPHTYKRSFWYIDKNCHGANSKMNHVVDVLQYLKSLIPEEYSEELTPEIELISSGLLKHRVNILSLCH